MKAKACFFWLTILLITSIQMAYPQSISFDSPSEGQVIANTSSNSETNITVNLVIKATGIAPLQSPNYAYIRVYDQNWVLLYGPQVSSYDNNKYTLSHSLQLAPGTYILHATLTEYFGINDYRSDAGTSVDFHVKHTISVINNFLAGNIKVDNATLSSGTPIYKYIGDLTSLEAIDQLYNGYYYTWNTSSDNTSNWKRKPMIEGQAYIPNATTRNYSYTVASNDNGATISSDMRKILSLTFQNYIVGLGNAGVITVNGTQYNSPYSNSNVIEGTLTNAIAPGQTINGIDYYLNQWNDGSKSSSLTFNSSVNAIYTAYYIGAPASNTISMGYDIVVGQPIKMHWTDNPNPNVTYQIWRNIKGGSGPVLIATVGRGVQTFTDYNYLFTGTYTNDLLYYDVRQYYSVEGTYSNTNFLSVYGKIAPKALVYNKLDQGENITSYFVGCYPNPFNPSTTINYQLPEAGLVSLRIFDLMGREVKTLVNEIKEKGSYNISFDASNLSSGVYFYQLRAGDYVSIKKMVLLK